MPNNDFNQEVCRLYPWLLAKAFYLCSSKADAEDIAMDVVCKMLENAHKFNAGMPIKPWAAAILNNTFCSWYNRRRLVEFISIDCVEGLPSHLSHPDARVVIKSILHTVRQCAHLSNTITGVILYAKGYSYAEISKTLCIPLGTVRSRIHIGRKILSERME